MIKSNNEGGSDMICDVISILEDDWDAIQETFYLHSVPGLVDDILAGDKEKLDECEIYDPNKEW